MEGGALSPILHSLRLQGMVFLPLGSLLPRHEPSASRPHLLVCLSSCVFAGEDGQSTGPWL